MRNKNKHFSGNFVKKLPLPASTADYSIAAQTGWTKRYAVETRAFFVMPKSSLDFCIGQGKNHGSHVIRRMSRHLTPGKGQSSAGC
jgi:hypothetical protein